jgi:S1-C subfamily serine protease
MKNEAIAIHPKDPHHDRSMNTKLLRLATSGLAILGTATGIMILDAMSPVELLNPIHIGQSTSHQAIAQDVEEEVNVRVYRLASPAVVSIDTGTANGSGSIISPDGLILTNAHVVQDAQIITVTLADGREFQGEVIGFGDQGLDLAAIQIQGASNLPTIQVAPSNSVQVGQRAFAIGNPFGRFQGTLTTGIVSRVDRDRGLIQTDAALNPGNSGGPLLNNQGQLIGVNTAIYTTTGASGNIGIGFAIPVERIQPFLVAVREGRAARTAQQPTPGLTQPPQQISLNSEPIQGRLTVNSNVLPADNSYFNAYSFEGRAGQQVEITMASNQLNAYLILVSPDGKDLAQDDDSAGGNDARIVVTLPANGTYTILANSYGAGEVGDYRLRVATGGSGAQQAMESRPQPIPQPRSQPGFLLQEQGTLGPGAQVLQSDGSLYQEHAFQGSAGQTITIRMESDDFDPYLILVGPNDEVIAQNDDATETDQNSSITVTLPQTGTYLIIANAYDSSGRGRYLITVR